VGRGGRPGHRPHRLRPAVRRTHSSGLSEEHIQVLAQQLLDLVNEPGEKKLLLNFRNVEYMSSAVLGMLVTLNKKIQAAGGKLVLCNIDPAIREVFEITKLDKLFVIRGEEQEGLQAF
jgi:anti-sigma B factor antagonist